MRYIHPDSGLIIGVSFREKTETIQLISGETYTIQTKKEIVTQSGQPCMQPDGDPEMRVLVVLTDKGQTNIVRAD